MDDDIGHVAMDEQLARHQPDDFVGRDPAIRAPDPEVSGRLLVGEGREEARPPLFGRRGPGAILDEEVLKGWHARQCSRPAPTQRDSATDPRVSADTIS